MRSGLEDDEKLMVPNTVGQTDGKADVRVMDTSKSFYSP